MYMILNNKLRFHQFTARGRSFTEVKGLTRSLQGLLSETAPLLVVLLLLSSSFYHFCVFYLFWGDRAHIKQS